MNHPRIIIADLDSNYIIPLQQKFIKEYFEKVDIEIITDLNYYQSLFSTPQKVDILIISEKFYTLNIHRHDIGNIFLMTENFESNRENKENITRIYKYTSIKEIFNKIVSISNKSISFDSQSKKESQIILIDSACGGVGKTTIALGISACLAQNYKRVLYINAARLQTFQTLLEKYEFIVSVDIYAKLASNSNNIYQSIKQVIKNEGFNYLPPFKSSLMSLGIDYSIYEKITISAMKSKEYDFIIIDADNVFDENKTRLIDLANKVILVAKQNKASVNAINVLMKNIDITSSDKYMFICNDFDAERQNYMLSNNRTNNFNINEYVKHLKNYDQLKANDLANESDIQKITFLIL